MTKGTPQTMKAWVQTDDYGLENLKLETAHPVPTIDDSQDQVLIKVQASSINPVDYKLMKGNMSLFMKRSFPHVVGFDVCGIIVAKSKASKGDFKVGDVVYGDTGDRGSCAEYMVCPSDFVVKKPQNISAEEAASVPLVGLTAYQGLKFKGNIKKGDKVLVLGGSGGVGSMAIQMAKIMGAKHVTTTSSNVELVDSLGADQVINYKEGKWEVILNGAEYDIVFDCVGGGWERSHQVLKKGGVFVTISSEEENGPDVLSIGRVFSMVGNTIGRKAMAAIGMGPNYEFFLTNAGAPKDMTEISEWIEARKLRVIMDPTSPYKYEDTKDAFKLLMSHRAKGKLAISW
ncbi:hypothetical protein SARC_00274 [Sphaeroforma arctica JP610]|uniref:Enoyl reductase (ER) domain-containing protein n=1 Tax=Sphaeroforma arctica JP610 TaxID=667725 RepID=A0A0L0GF31_9EUKA|nr:hypothetical protein SARC_00274 [Sphaeroforma arctica JP610]KNC87645.1 hypothetical protein SARC_00274 [Sphaeroforma arctica JP610]|eukprot:XP_014161547.1 hypothetical protein SARC_00274 [Sphaeroforma arctica JP610]